MGTLSVDKLMKTSTGAAEFTLPATDGSAGNVMQTDGSGQLSVAAIAASSVGTTQIADNAVTANKLADSAYVAGRNKVINGQFDVWQRGTTISVSANANIYYCDRWRHEGYAFSGSVSQQTFTNGQTTVPDNPTYYARLIITTNSSGYQAFVQRIENYPVNRLSGKTITVSFWIKSVSGTLADGVIKAYGKSSLVGSGTDNIGAITTSWQKIEYTGTLGNVTGTYYTVGLNIAQNTILSSGVDISNVQVEVGDTPTPFEQKTFGQELADCQRYFNKTFAYATAPANGAGHTWTGALAYDTRITTQSANVNWQYPVAMRALPTVTLYNTRTGGAAGQWTTGGSDSANARALTTSETTAFIDNGGIAIGAASWGIWATASAEN